MTNRTQRKRKTRDLFLTVKDVARETGVDAHVVRFYARTGLIRPVRHAANGYRQFVPLDVKRVRFVRAAQNLGFTLAEIREILLRSRQHTTPCPLVRDVIEKRLRENRDRLTRVRALQERMEYASERWRHLPDGVPDGEIICALIEAVADDAPTAPAGARPLASSHLRRRA
jgi:DNA-binding transcriptional MerR regulator